MRVRTGLTIAQWVFTAAALLTSPVASKCISLDIGAEYRSGSSAFTEGPGVRLQLECPHLSKWVGLSASSSFLNQNKEFKPDFWINHGEGRRARSFADLLIGPGNWRGTVGKTTASDGKTSIYPPALMSPRGMRTPKVPSALLRNVSSATVTN